jgi:hypothetical protein
MTNHVSRRNILKLGSAAAALPLLAWYASPSNAVAAMAPAVTGISGLSLQPFQLSNVALGPGLMAQKRELILNFARGYDERRYVNVFRANAGLKPLADVVPLPAGGWEGLDGEANGNLRGHFTGHHMSMLAQAFASTGEAVFASKLGNLVSSLHECRQALSQEPTVQSTEGRVYATAADVARGSYVYGSLPAGSVDGLTSMTFAAWVRPTAAVDWVRIFDFGNDVKTYAFLTQRDNNGVPRFAITQNWAAGEQTIVGSSPLPLGEWSHVAVTLGNGTGTLYVNGKQAGQNNAMTLTPAALGHRANVWLGRSQYNDPLYAGAYQDVNIWSTALTPVQVNELTTTKAAASSVRAGDVVSLACDETSGSTLNDASGKGRHATIRRTWGVPSHPGFLAAYPETQFIELETRTTSDYTRVWAPYYTAHKILKGLLDAHTATHDPKALDLALGLCDWMYSRLSKLTPEVRQRMWGIFSSGEYGGIVEAILETYGHSGSPEHLQLAKYFNLDYLIDACAENRDVLTGLHANQHIPIFTGLMLLHNATGEERYFSAARNFWNMVVQKRLFSIGGTSTGEFWRGPNEIASTLNDTDAETCCAYNMLKLSRELFFKEQNPAFMDYYERALMNQILGSKQDQQDAELPLATYFIGLQPGAVRDFTPKRGTTCCEGTGMESATKYQDSAYFTTEDNSSLYVNLYIPSTLNWQTRNITITQATTYPFEQRTKLTVSGSGQFDIKLRVPAWATAGFNVRVNGVPLDTAATPGSYLNIARSWANGDTLDVDMPFPLRAERANDDATVQTLMYGPIHLVARDARTSLLPVGLYAAAKLDGDLSRAAEPIAGKPLHFMLGGVELAPFFEGTTDAFHSYFRRTEPTVVFDGINSGVSNPARPDKTTLLDDIWSTAPFQNKSFFLQRVSEVTKTWVTAGSLSQTDADRIYSAAEKATFASSGQSLAVSATAGTRCVAGKVVLTVEATNADTVPMEITITSAYGQKSFASVQPGKKAVHAFTTRAASIVAGKATVQAKATRDGQLRNLSLDAPYSAGTC